MVNDEVTKVRVKGDGSTKTVSFAFKYLQDTDLKVCKIATDVTPEVATLQVLNTDYTVAACSPQGGVVTFTTALSVAEDGFVKLDEPYTQAVDIPSAGVFREEALEAGLDKPVLLCQQLREEVSRAIKLPETSLITSVAFGEPVADRALVWQDDGGGAWTAVSSASNPDDAATYASAAAAASANSASSSASTATTQAGIATTQAGIATAAAGSVPSMASIFPVGTIYSNASDSRNPATIFGFTSTWVALEGVVVVGYKSGDANFGTPGANVGVASVILTAAQSGLPAHRHNITYGSAEGPTTGRNVIGSPTTTSISTTLSELNTAADASQAHTNIQPSVVAYCWKRTA